MTKAMFVILRLGESRDPSARALARDRRRIPRKKIHVHLNRQSKADHPTGWERPEGFLTLFEMTDSGLSFYGNTMKTSNLVRYLDTYLNVARMQDRSNNGLQVQPESEEVTRVAFAVDACLASFKAAIEAHAQLLVVHHGLFWSEHIQLTGAHFERVKTLICGGCGLYASHIPLDAHAEVGNNIELARIIGLQNVQPWGTHKGSLIGFIGNLPQPMQVSELSAVLEAKIGRGKGTQTHPTPNPSPEREGSKASRVAICSGFGVTFLDEAIAAGADTLLTGETSHQWFHRVDESSINVIYGGHYNTEMVGLKALARHIEQQFGLETIFIDLPTGL